MRQSRPSYFVTDSASINKRAVRQFMNDIGDEHWFQCSVHFCQLPMRDAVRYYLDGESHGDLSDQESLPEMLTDNQLIDNLRKDSNKGSFNRIVTTCPAIRKWTRISHSNASLFQEVQNNLGVSRCIVSDVKTRFDSTFDLLESIIMNQTVLKCLQEKGRGGDSVWTKPIHLSPDDFMLIQTIVSVLKPIRIATKQLSAIYAWIGDVIHILTSTIDAVREMVVPTNSSTLQSLLLESLSVRVHMLLDSEEELPVLGGQRFSSVEANEFVVSSYLNPRFCLAMDACFNYSERLLVGEMDRLYNEFFSNNNDSPCNRQENNPNLTQTSHSENLSPVGA